MQSDDNIESDTNNSDDHTPAPTTGGRNDSAAAFDVSDGVLLGAPSEFVVVGAGAAVAELEERVDDVADAVELAPSIRSVLAVGAASAFDSKFPPSLRASSTALSRSSSALSGTSERKPIRGGSTDGCVRLP